MMDADEVLENWSEIETDSDASSMESDESEDIHIFLL